MGLGGKVLDRHAPGMSAPVAAIRVKRKLTNRLIAARDAPRLGPHMIMDMVLIVGDGALVQGREDVITAFGAEFANPSLLSCVHTTEAVQVAEDEGPAAEHGRCVGTWTGGVEISGDCGLAPDPRSMAPRP